MMDTIAQDSAREEKPQTRRTKRIGKKRDLKLTLRRLGITQQEVADEARVHVTHVSHVLSGRYRSRFVLAAIRRMIARIETRV